jgi:hypothetical protein
MSCAHHNPLFLDPRISRREMLRCASNGFGALALTALFGSSVPGPAPGHDAALPGSEAPHFQPGRAA